MKPVQLIAILGGLLIVGVVGWYLYMESNPPYAIAPVRGLDMPAAGAKTSATSKAAPQSAPASAAPTSAPASAAPASAAP